MKDVLKSMFNPKKYATGAFGGLGKSGGELGGKSGYLGEQYGSDNEYKPETHFDMQGYFDLTKQYDPNELLKGTLM